MEETEPAKLTCTFCEKSSDKLILFTEITLKKCKIILQQRVTHNLKLKDVVLPEDLYDKGYHRECYKNFTALPKKYYSEIPEKTKISKNKSSPSIVDKPFVASTSILPSSTSTNSDPSTASTSTEQNNSTVADSDLVSNSISASATLEPFVISEPNVDQEEDVSNNITDDDEDDDLVGQYRDWLNDENSNNCYEDCDD
ncbi:unnamed protein product [Arctia plantaginis]|uniref:Uncharacterized protein n=1 Tax=Arctia plantaginis TaxID=874455 RepID=A0A8S1AMU1_ARCPL|nr:unnamed protein product [Arctia plantaginis]